MANAFRRFGLFTVASVYLLILVGGVVRSTGSGMGCPDWPKCFGQWVPPTQESELPPDYRAQYVEQRKEKNLKFAKLLQALGAQDMARQVSGDPSVYASEPFNATKTWIEYLNRLLGVLIGFFILLAFVFSLGFWKKDRTVSLLSGLALAMVIFQAVLGAIVVYTNLLPSTITLHMLVALAIVAVLIYAVARSYGSAGLSLPVVEGRGAINRLLWACMGTFVLQVVLGTQVREAIDKVAASLQHTARETWIDQLGLSFYIHRTYSLLILGLHVWLLVLLRRRAAHASVYYWANVVALLLLAEIATGAAMAYLAIPAFLQPVHLALAALVFGAQFWVWLLVNPEKLRPGSAHSRVPAERFESFVVKEGKS